MTTATQTSIAVAPPIGMPGQLYSGAGQNDEIIERRAAVAIPFGAYVHIHGEDCELPIVPADIATHIGGIALHDERLATGVGYKVGDLVRVLRKGKVWGATEMQVLAGGPAFFKPTTNKWVLAAGLDAGAPPTATYLLAPTAALAVIEINQPGDAPTVGEA